MNNINYTIRNDKITVDHPAIRFPPPLVLLSAIGLGAAISMLAPMPVTRKGWLRLAGIPLFAAGLGLSVTALQSMNKIGTTPDPGRPVTALVTQGPYRFTRNPIYLGMALLISSLGLLANSLWFLPLAGAFMLMLQTQVIRYEEAYLENKFGADYTEYKGQVRRWI